MRTLVTREEDVVHAAPEVDVPQPAATVRLKESVTRVAAAAPVAVTTEPTATRLSATAAAVILNRARVRAGENDISTFAFG